MTAENGGGKLNEGNKETVTNSSICEKKVTKKLLERSRYNENDQIKEHIQ